VFDQSSKVISIRLRKDGDPSQSAATMARG
jgi:hypothetical protein